MEEEGPAARRGLRAGDRLAVVNDQVVADELDLLFQLDDEDSNRLSFERDGVDAPLERDFEPGHLGIQWRDFDVRLCKNKCVFCYVHQLPKGMRRSLYVMDEDLRLSFLYGSFSTLSNLSDEDRQRIVTQRLSPIYVSVHATDETVRRAMLRGRRFANSKPILEDLDFFLSHRIEIHTQVVVCPGLNGGEVLERSVADLMARAPGIRSLAVVPVGLTQHRRNLPPVVGFDRDSARDELASIEALQVRCERDLGEPFLYAGDEFYVMAERPLPPLEHYGDLEQLDNGVGLVRYWQSLLNEATSEIEAPTEEVRVLVLTGSSAAPFLERDLARPWNLVEGVSVRVRAVPNDLFGEQVTAANLISGHGALEALAQSRTEGFAPTLVLLPPKSTNDDELFLDDLSLSEATERAGVPLVPAPDDSTQLAALASGGGAPVLAGAPRRLYVE